MGVGYRQDIGSDLLCIQTRVSQFKWTLMISYTCCILIEK